MSLAHLTLPTRHVQGTASFLEHTLGYTRHPVLMLGGVGGADRLAVLTALTGYFPSHFDQ
jgi:uncharacterized protein related to proFAR isomerase